MEESIEFITELIEIYKKHPALWNYKEKCFTNSELKEKGYREMVVWYKTVDSTANIDTVIRKINSLKRAYKKERKRARKLSSGELSDKFYRPTLWYYNLFKLIDDQIHSRAEIKNDENKESADHEIGSQSVGSQNLNEESKTPSNDNISSSRTRRDFHRYPTTHNIFNETNKNSYFCELLADCYSQRLRYMDVKQRAIAENIFNTICEKGFMRELSEGEISRGASHNVTVLTEHDPNEPMKDLQQIL